jgi:hypothetical protein
MKDMVNMPERVATLSPIVTPLPFYRRPYAWRQLAIATIAVAAMVVGVLRWGQLVLSVPDATAIRASKVNWTLPPVRPPVRLELVVVDVEIIDESPAVAETTPCL